MRVTVRHLQLAPEDSSVTPTSSFPRPTSGARETQPTTSLPAFLSRYATATEAAARRRQLARLRSPTTATTSDTSETYHPDSYRDDWRETASGRSVQPPWHADAESQRGETGQSPSAAQSVGDDTLDTATQLSKAQLQELYPRAPVARLAARQSEPESTAKTVSAPFASTRHSATPGSEPSAPVDAPLEAARLDTAAIQAAEAALLAPPSAASVNYTPALLLLHLQLSDSGATTTTAASGDNNGDPDTTGRSTTTAGSSSPARTGSEALLLQPYHAHTIADMIRVSPGVVQRSMAKPLFVAYQLVLALRQLHAQGLYHGRLVLTF